MTVRTIPEYIAVLCRDCGVIFPHHHRRGHLPLRCDECRRELQRGRRRQWYQENRESILQSLREQWQAARLTTKEVACRDCGATLHVDVTRGRNQYLCVACRDAARLAAKTRYREKNREMLREKNAEYARKRRNEDPGQLEREREAAARFRAANPERMREIQKRSYWKHVEARRARRREHQIRHRLAIYERDNGICHICLKLVSRDAFEIDHIVPVSRGGSSEESNLALSHMVCNRRKAARLLAEVV